ncbi:MAG TPA: response regulator transcription factor [Bryobacteraceae bacterium]|nr:response regulator transcription factor [Bryobacteraceae bacterium]
MSFRVLIADDHGIVRQGLRALLEKSAEVSVVGEAADGREAVRLAGELQPDIIVMDIAMPLLNGVDAASQIISRNADIKVIVLSMHSDESYILRALSAGAKGYLLKDSAEGDILPAVRAVAQGRPYFSPVIAATLLEEYLQTMKKHKVEDSYDLLTDREKEVLQLLAEGKSNKEVAALLDLSPYTVESHRTNLMQKLNLHNTAEIVLYAVRKNIILP